MDAEYIQALIYAAELGVAYLPHVKIELCAPCHGLKLTATYGMFTETRIVSWDTFRVSRTPLYMLTEQMYSMRRNLEKAVP